MRKTVRLARAHGVAVGAHPGFPDLLRLRPARDARSRPQEVEDLVLYQVSALAGIAQSEGVRLQHVKAHGALYNMACRDEALAEAIARAVVAFDPTLVLFGLPDSALLQAGLDAGLPVAAEAFADRAYHADGSLVSRSEPGSVIHELDTVVARAVRDGVRGDRRGDRRHDASRFEADTLVRAWRHARCGRAGRGRPPRARRRRRHWSPTHSLRDRPLTNSVSPRIKLVRCASATLARNLACFFAARSL